MIEKGDLLRISQWASKIEWQENQWSRDYTVYFITGSNVVGGVISYKALLIADSVRDEIYRFTDKLDEWLFDEIFDNAESELLLC